MSIVPHPHSDSKYPWVDRCGEPSCLWRVAVKEPIPRYHKCPHLGGTTHFAWSITVTLVEEMWHRLDSVMDELALLQAEPEPDHDMLLTLKGRARGIAEMIAIFMRPHFSNANEVAREAKRRADARAREDKEYETRGLGQYRYSPPSAEEAVKYKREPEKRPKPAIVSEDDAAKIRKAFNHFPIEMLAKTFGITEAQVKTIAESEPTISPG